MVTKMDLGDFAKYFAYVEKEIPGTPTHHGMVEACKIIEEEAKRVLGTYDYGWEPLKPETIARKAHGDTPLLETGELRDSITSAVVDGKGYVGSNNKKALFHEFGTSRIPPRPFISGAAMHKGREAAEAIAKSWFAFFMLGRMV